MRRSVAIAHEERRRENKGSMENWMVRYVDGKIGEGGWIGGRVDDGWRMADWADGGD